jgi:hypothetical protein
MGIIVAWDNEADKRTIRFDIRGYWTWGDLGQALNAGVKLGEGIPKPVNVILNLQPDFRPRIATPKQIKDIRDAYAANIQHLIVVSDDLFIKKRIEAFGAAYPAFRGRVQSFPTLEAARGYIARSYAAHGNSNLQASSGQGKRT